MRRTRAKAENRSAILNHRTDRSLDRANRMDMLSLKLSPSSHKDISLLVSYDRKLRHHPEKQIAKLMAGIAEYGFLVSVLIDERNRIIAGEARVEAARRLGMQTIPVCRIDHLSPAQIRAFRIAENKLGEAASWDMQALALEIDEILSISEISVEVIGFETAELDLVLESRHAAPPDQVHDPLDDIPEMPSNPVTRPGDLWVLGRHRLLCGSCIEQSSWVTLMNGKLARMAFTDPPYNVAINGHVSGLGKVRHAEFAMASGEMDEAGFMRFNETYLGFLASHLVDGAVIDVCMDWRHIDVLMSAARACRLKPINLCVWNKASGGMGSLYRSKHELVLILKRGSAPHINNVQLGSTGRYRTNVWDYAGANSFGASRAADLADHPTVKPTALVADAIRDVTDHGDVVLDAFVGSGTTILAAQRSGRVAYGIEIEPSYVDVAFRRWSEMTREEAVLQSTGETFASVRDRRIEETRNAENGGTTPHILNPRPRRRPLAV